MLNWVQFSCILTFARLALSQECYVPGECTGVVSIYDLKKHDKLYFTNILQVVGYLGDI